MTVDHGDQAGEGDESAGLLHCCWLWVVEVSKCGKYKVERMERVYQYTERGSIKESLRLKQKDEKEWNGHRPSNLRRKNVEGNKAACWERGRREKQRARQPDQLYIQRTTGRAPGAKSILRHGSRLQTGIQGQTSSRNLTSCIGLLHRKRALVICVGRGAGHSSGLALA